jgi:hypothetical protein
LTTAYHVADSNFAVVQNPTSCLENEQMVNIWHYLVDAEHVVEHENAPVRTQIRVFHLHRIVMILETRTQLKNNCPTVVKILCSSSTVCTSPLAWAISVLVPYGLRLSTPKGVPFLVPIFLPLTSHDVPIVLPL